jgi:NAD(P)H-dependent FMN reductase
LQQETRTMNIEIIAGSPRNPSLNARVAKYLHQYLQDTTSHNIGLIELNKTVLPFIQNVWTSPDHAPEAFRPLAERMFAADAFIISSPEYNGAYSPAMKNLFDHFPKQNKKVFGICTTSNGIMGGIRASQQLLQLVPALFGIASPFLLIVPQTDKKFDENGKLIAPEFQKNVEDFAREFIGLAEKLKSN